jgi:hypothetical protein
VSSEWSRKIDRHDDLSTCEFMWQGWYSELNLVTGFVRSRELAV